MKPTVSLTFDDGLPCQAKYALPILDRFGAKATFFLPVDSAEYPVDFKTWKQAAENGHEIGSHSMTHRKAAQLTAEDCIYETRQSQSDLTRLFGIPVVQSYCFPYTDAPAPLQTATKKFYDQARGGRGARQDKYYQKASEVNFYNVACLHVGPTTIANCWDWAKEARNRKAWVVLMLHGVGQPGTWDNIEPEQLDELVRCFAEAGCDIKTFADGADAIRKG